MIITDEIVCRYPLEVVSAKRQTQTLSVEAALDLPGEIITNKGEKLLLPPMHMHSPYSRFVWTLIDISGPQKVYPSANIPAGDVSVIKTLTDAMLMKNRLMPRQKSEETGGLAYTTKIMVSKKFSGRTPAGILLDDAGDLDDLLSTRDFLLARMDDNNGKFRERNQQQADAIQEAVDLCQAGKLSPEAVQGEAPVVVYFQPNKTLRNRPAKGNHYFTYSIKIECVPGLNYPWFVSIFNAYMQIQEKANGTFQSISGTAIDKSSSRIQLSDYEFGGIVNRMYATLQNFETVFFRHQFQEARRLDQEQREKREAQYEQDDGYYQRAS